jgi:hypothetical protein
LPDHDHNLSELRNWSTRAIQENPMSDIPGDPLTPLTEEEKQGMTSLFFENKKEFRKVLVELFNKHAMRELFGYNGIPHRVKTTFDTMVADIISEGFGVDTRSFDRKYTGPWADKVRELVQASIKEHIEKYDPHKDVWTAAQLQSLRRSWVAQYKQTFAQHVMKSAHERARADAEVFMRELISLSGR